MRITSITREGTTLCALLFLSLAVLVISPAESPVYWHVASNGLPSDVQALAVAPSPPRTSGLAPTLYAGTWSDGIFRSTDHDTTW